ncbi:type II toxin-antitoxin system Phd/YefM family antitoxin [Rhizobium sp. B21/90]|uniref:type II toxin-antitoxin system Phd/YefM family antitoxin n=1 Tax=Rhizobium sp. B21/90 TaxID=2819993 RepID=UPI001C5A7567|nr:type II toxin-antitoxin system prevent-host-death family antitoxin [Rhizobium sp. B21/90]
MSVTFKVADAKTHLSELLARVEAGEEIIIARGNDPVARLVSIDLRISLNRDSGFSKSRTSVSLSRGQRMRSNPGCLVAVTRDCVRLFRRRSRASAFFVCACCRLRE